MSYNPSLKRFEVITSYQEYMAGYVQKVKDAGFIFEKEPRALWHTDDPGKASLLISCADETAKDMLGIRAKQREESLALSRAQDADLGAVLDDLGIKPYDFQKAGIAYASTRERVLFADEPGLGKTLQALAAVHLRWAYPCVAVVPATIKINWLKEARRCIPELREEGAVRIITGRAKKEQSLIESKREPGAMLYIINYDILRTWLEHLIAIYPKALIVDESHFAKNIKADRTLACLELATGIKREGRKRIKVANEIQYRYLLSGTPEPNRPAELVSQLEILGVIDKFSGSWNFLRQFCDLTEEWIWIKNPAYFKDHKQPKAIRKKIFHYDGATDTDTLQRMLRENVMVRRLKDDVMKDLPPKRHQCIELACNGLKHFVDEENELEDRFNESKDRLEAEKKQAFNSGNQESFERAAAELDKVYKAHFSEMARLAHECAMAKVPLVIEYCLELLEGEKKLAVFAHHHDVEKALETAFRTAGKKVAMLTGLESPKEKNKAIEDFQDGNAEVFIGGLKCAVGYTITAASRVVMAELDWTPGVMDQASDRPHRIGQTDSVLVTYITLENSLDAKKVGMLISKRDVARKVLDNPLNDFTVPPGIPEPKTEKPDLPPTHVFVILERLGIKDDQIPF